MKERKALLSDALSQIDLCYVEEAAEASVKKNVPISRQFFTRVLPAACLCILIAIGVFHIPLGDRGTDTTPTLPQTQGADIPQEDENSYTEIEVVFPWKDAQYLMGFDSGNKGEMSAAVEIAVEKITEGKYAAYEAGQVIDASLVGERLDTVTVKTYWYFVPQKAERDVTYIGGEVYAIKDVSPDAAVCVRYTEKGVANTTTHYYIYSNPAWQGESLEKFYTAFDLEEYLVMTQSVAYLFTRDTLESGNGELRTRISMTEAERAEIRAMLLSLTGERKSVTNAEELDAYIADSMEQAQLIVRANTVWNRYFAIQVFDNGYLMIVQGTGAPMLFEIGEDASTELLFLMKQAEIVEAEQSGTEETVRYSPE